MGVVISLVNSRRVTSRLHTFCNIAFLEVLVQGILKDSVGGVKRTRDTLTGCTLKFNYFVADMRCKLVIMRI